MIWKYNESGDYWIASKPMCEGSNCDFIYTIYPMMGGGYTAEAMNNGYGARRVAVDNIDCKDASVFHDLKDLIDQIENRNIYWLYTGACNCIGKITKEEY